MTTFHGRDLDIGVDLDGVAYDFPNSLRHFLIHHEGWDPADLPGGDHDDPNATWSFYKDCWGMSTEDFLAACDRGVDAGVVFLHGEPFNDTVDTLAHLRERGHRIHIITARSFGSRSHHNTSEWLERHGVPFDSLVFSSHKTIIRPDVMIDDHTDNFLAFMRVGVPCYLYDRPWNRGFDDEGYRVRSWNDFLRRVELMEHA